MTHPTALARGVPLRACCDPDYPPISREIPAKVGGDGGPTRDGSRPATWSTAPPAPPSVHALETPLLQTNAGALTDLELDFRPGPAQFRHLSWRPARQRIWRALVEAGEPRSRLVRFANCGSNFTVLQSADDGNLFRVAAVRCHDRFCIPCNRERSTVIEANLDQLCQQRVVRLITLTLAHSADPLKRQLDRLLDSFKKLRKQPVFRERVAGGAAFLELQRNPDTRQWHPHLHILAEGRFLPQDQLRQAWHTITGDSFIVDVRAIRDPAAAIRDVAKYATKPLTTAVLADPAALREAIIALKHRKILYTFGRWRKTRLLTPSDAGHWHVIADDWEVPSLKGLPDYALTAITTALARARRTGEEAEFRVVPRAPPT